MDRSQIPWRLAAARGATIARIPSATLATMAPCDLAPRLLAHDALIRKATDALTETDPRQVAAIMKAAGVPWSGHEAMTGTHKHAHPAYGSQGGDATHEHEHTHRGDANHRHTHASAKSTRPDRTGKSAAQLAADAVRAAAGLPAASSKPATRSATGAAAKARDADQQATMDHLAKIATAAVERASAGLGLRIDEVALRVRGAHGTIASAAGDVLAKAAAYEAKTARMTCAEDRAAYLELARAERDKAGAR